MWWLVLVKADSYDNFVSLLTKFSHHVEGDTQNLLLASNRSYHHQVEEDTDHRQTHVSHHDQSSWSHKYFVDAEEKIFEYLPLFMWDHSLTSRVILRKVSSVLFVSIFLQTNIIFIQILLGQSGNIYKHKQPIKNHTSTDILR